ncbi:MAG: hypothetical protein A2086_03145 [Spirochaetes bacterium GWD1_27_9]|nr:MAG: hypothetical protein A2Z98_00475 [Spirochaetes bacterium GWB1_27_13]OHD21304.1 MAG: hypothetical protein A2Y34_06475 [Spirochaetes bacterium GWC1_27_15]OHD39798.1 MAG: hypothetical protein A2086_03145 [Spirochaetes bacterium GWD1_27_9]
MAKKMFILLFFIQLFSLQLFSEVLLITDGSVIKGKIVKMDEDNFVVLSSYGEIVVERKKVKQFFQTDEEYQNYLNQQKTKDSSGIVQPDKKDSNLESVFNKMLEEEKRKKELEKLKIQSVFWWSPWLGFTWEFKKDGLILAGKEAILNAMTEVPEAQELYKKYWNIMAGGWVLYGIGLAVICLSPLPLLALINNTKVTSAPFIGGLVGFSVMITGGTIMSIIGVAVAYVYNRKRGEAIQLYNNEIEKKFSLLKSSDIILVFDPAISLDKDINPVIGLNFNLKM